MTEQQRKLFSSEWRALFDHLEAKGYTVTFSNGLIITNGINRLTARYERCRWHVALERIAFGPETYTHRQTTHIIGRIEYMLAHAHNRPQYDLRLKELTA